MATATPTLPQLAEDKTLLSMVPRTETRPFLRFWTKSVVLPGEYYIEVDGQRLFEYELISSRYVLALATMQWHGTCAPVDNLDAQYEILTEQAFPDLRHRIVGIRRI
ncbi:MAG TPA: hypothetical protein VK694_03215 [Verrucomicrobiae bacterium]|nr:hypothetical protein [Verrucomicrobiae bacterium]